MAIDMHVYGTYGYQPGNRRAHAAYVGAVREAGEHGYLLGERIYDPRLRRFLKPDSLSPFNAGGLNRYAYCGGDPVGRVDHSGQSWYSWLVSTLDRIEFPITVARDAAGAESTFATPTLRAVGTIRQESLPLRSAVERGAPAVEMRRLIKAYGASRVPIKGPRASGTFVFQPREGVTGIQWPKQGSTASTTFFTADERTIQVIEGPLVFRDDLRRAGPAARGKPKSHWLERTNRAGGAVFAATTSVGVAPLRDLKKFITHKYPAKSVTVFAGGHGTPNGNHWSADGTPRYPSQTAYDKVKKEVSALGWSVTMLNYSDVGAEGMRSLMEGGEGAYVHFTCYGAADPNFMQAFNIWDVTLRKFEGTSAPNPP